MNCSWCYAIYFPNTMLNRKDIKGNLFKEFDENKKNHFYDMNFWSLFDNPCHFCYLSPKPIKLSFTNFAYKFWLFKYFFFFFFVLETKCSEYFSQTYTYACIHIIQFPKHFFLDLGDKNMTGFWKNLIFRQNVTLSSMTVINLQK